MPLTLSSRDKQGLGNGLWKLSPAGQLTQLAGFDKPARTPMADGTGPSAVFQSTTTVCAGPQGTLYVNDLGRVRQVAPDGTVVTLTGNGGANFEGLACGQGGSNLTTMPDSGGPRKAYELQSQRSLAAPLGGGTNYQGLAMNGADSAWVSAANGGSITLMELADGGIEPGSVVDTASGISVGANRYTTSLPALRSAGGGVAYLPTAYSIIRLTYEVN